MGKTKVVIDADAERQATGVEVRMGGKTYVGLEPTIEEMREVAEILPDTDVDETAAPGVQLNASLDMLYPQLEKLLREQVQTENGKGTELGDPPPQDLVEKHLSVKQAARILRALTAEDDEGNG